MGAWIETFLIFYKRIENESRPAWARGLMDKKGTRSLPLATMPQYRPGTF